MDQLGYVVEDITAGVEHWLHVMGVGPFFVMRGVGIDGAYEGDTPQPIGMDVAFSYLGDTQIELIRPLGERPLALPHVRPRPLRQRTAPHRPLHRRLRHRPRRDTPRNRSHTAVPRRYPGRPPGLHRRRPARRPRARTSSRPTRCTSCTPPSATRRTPGTAPDRSGRSLRRASRWIDLADAPDRPRLHPPQPAHAVSLAVAACLL
ncbi:VOC family protein [Yinghuangia aomiensis]